MPGYEELRDKHAKVYLEEARDLLQELEGSVLMLEERPGDGDLIGRIFRALHTIKGSGAMFGFAAVASFTHEVETAFDRVRQGRIAVSREIIDLTLRARDHIRRLIEAESTGAFMDEAEGEAILDLIRAAMPKESPQPEAAPALGAVSMAGGEKAVSRKAATYRIRFRPSPDVYLKGMDPLDLLDELRGLGLALVVARLSGIPPLGSIDPESCLVYWDVVLMTDKGMDAVRDVFVFVEDGDQAAIERIDDGTGFAQDLDYKRLGEILVERGDVERQEILRLIEERRPIGEILVERGLIDGAAVESALIEQRCVKQARQDRQAEDLAASVRVPAHRLDKLVDLVGELVTVQARLSQTAARRMDPELLGIAEEVERHVAELHDIAMGIRMVPIGSMFGRFARLVRDLSAELGKDVRLLTEGGETELDKNVIDRLGDPLMHLVRNALDHGIEPLETRLNAGKPRQGAVRLGASHAGSDVFIEISDDGAGIDPEHVRIHAAERGLLGDDAPPLSEDQAHALLFSPGFSTARRVTGVSGRGVGLDVVKKGVEALRGTVEVKSKKGLGTTVRLRLPLTLAIVEGLLVRIAGGGFVFPLAQVLECLELRRDDAAAMHGRRMIGVRGEAVPYIVLREQFLIEGERPGIEHVVVTALDGARVGFVVDAVIGGHQTVIKTLGGVLRAAPGLSGATILGDGSVALILDTARLYAMAHAGETGRITGRASQ